MRRRNRSILWVVIVLALVGALIVAGVVAGKIDNPLSQKPKPGPSNSAVVDGDGGTFTFPETGIVVKVPKGAVTTETKLSVGGATKLRAEDKAPLRGIRSGAVRFDITLSRGERDDIQPKKPLGLDIPLSGVMLPSGANPKAALVYTPNKRGDGYQIVKSSPVKNDVLSASLSHLSPKWVTYVSDEQLLASFRAEFVEHDRSACKQELTVGGDKIKIGGTDTFGWSLDDGSPLFACLTSENDQYVRVGMANRLYYILSVADTDNVRLASGKGDAEEEVVKYFTNTLFPDSHIDGYVGRNGKAVGSVKVDQLPATIQLKSDPNTFLAEGAWTALKMIATIITGETNNKTAERLMSATEVISCIQGAVDISTDNLPSMAGVIDLVLSKCTETIHAALADQIDPFNVTGRLLVVWNGLWDIVKVTRTSFDGIRMQFNGRMSVHVSGPAPKVAACPTDRQMEAAGASTVMAPSYDGDDVSGRKVLSTAVSSTEPRYCESGWARAVVQVEYEDSPGNGNTLGVAVLMRIANNQWVGAYDDLNSQERSSVCSQSMPYWAREWMSCS